MEHTEWVIHPAGDDDMVMDMIADFIANHYTPAGIDRRGDTISAVFSSWESSGADYGQMYSELESECAVEGYEVYRLSRSEEPIEWG